MLNTIARIKELSLNSQLSGLSNTGNLASLPEVGHLGIVIGVHSRAEVRQLIGSAVATPIKLRETQSKDLRKRHVRGDLYNRLRRKEVPRAKDRRDEQKIMVVACGPLVPARMGHETHEATRVLTV